MVDFREYHVDGSLGYDLGKTARRGVSCQRRCICKSC